MAELKRLILVGAGHAHAQVLNDWIAQPLPRVELVVVSPSVLAPYSGMVPGWLAGHYRFDEIYIDFATLCRAAGAVFLTDEASGLDAEQHRITLRGGAVLEFDTLSLNIGSTLTPPAVPGARMPALSNGSKFSPKCTAARAHMLSLRPLGELRAAWEALLGELALEPDQVRPGPWRITAVGGGAAGIEALLAARRRLAALKPKWQIEGQLVTRSDQLLPGMARGAARRATAALGAAGVTVRLNTAFDDDIAAASDLVLWATGAQAHAWPTRSTLAVGATGFIRIDAQLRSISHPQVFAVGDCADWTPSDPLPKAGVFAVRMGPVLSHNLRASLLGTALQQHAPRRRYLALLATADERAILAWDRFSAEGKWAWRWKDSIDRGFLARFDVPSA